MLAMSTLMHDQVLRQSTHTVVKPIDGQHVVRLPLYCTVGVCFDYYIANSSFPKVQLNVKMSLCPFPVLLG